MRWFGLGSALVGRVPDVAAPSLAVVVRGLPNDHYHAFADPMVFVLIGLGAAALVREVRAPLGPAARGVAAFGVLLGWNLPRTCRRRSIPTAGFPAGDAAARQVDTALSDRGIPRRGSDGRSYRCRTSSRPRRSVYPLARIGRSFVATLPKGAAVLGSVTSTGIGCAASSSCVTSCSATRSAPTVAARPRTAFAAAQGSSGPLLDRFEAAPGGGSRSTCRPADARPVDADMRTPAPQTPAFAVPETRTVEGDPGRALECSSSGRGSGRDLV